MDLSRLHLVSEHLVYVVRPWDSHLFLRIFDQLRPIDTIEVDFDVRLFHDKLVHMEDSLEGNEIGRSSDKDLELLSFLLLSFKQESHGSKL